GATPGSFVRLSMVRANRSTNRGIVASLGRGRTAGRTAVEPLPSELGAQREDRLRVLLRLEREGVELLIAPEGLPVHEPCRGFSEGHRRRRRADLHAESLAPPVRVVVELREDGLRGPEGDGLEPVEAKRRAVAPGLECERGRLVGVDG